MKKLFMLLIGILVSIGCIYAQEISLELINGRVAHGVVTEKTDTTITLLLDKFNQLYTVSVDRIQKGVFIDGSILTNENGKIKIETEDEIIQKLISSPNYWSGKALKISGATSLGIGIPCLLTGVATCIAGRVGRITTSNKAAKASCLDASYYLLGAGAAMTIVGIPLYVEGKKIMYLELNSSEKGIGVGLSF